MRGTIKGMDFVEITSGSFSIGYEIYNPNYYVFVKAMDDSLMCFYMAAIKESYNMDVGRGWGLKSPS